MVSNKLALFSASAALVESALGLHRGHQHQHLNKRAMETEWVTEWVTVWVTPGEGDAVPASCTGATSSASAGANTQVAESAAAEYTTVNQAPTSQAPTTTSTTFVVVPTTTSSSTTVVYNNGGGYTSQQVQTTLSTAIKSEAAVTYSAPQDTTTTVKQETVAAVSSSADNYVSTSQQAATTTSSAATTSNTQSSSSSSGYGLKSKRGISYNDVKLANTFAAACDNCGWAYNWGSGGDSADTALDSGLSYIPMLWGRDTNDWSKNATNAIAAGSKVLFSFNEPDMPSPQANIPYAEAATLHVTHMNPFAGKAKIGAPAVSNSDKDGQGLKWLQSWVDTCSNLSEPCHYDFCNIHWYNLATNADDLMSQVKKAYAICQKPIFITEFAPNDGTAAADITTFLNTAIPELEASDLVLGYAYFMVSVDRLMTSTTALSSFGQTYASAST